MPRIGKMVLQKRSEPSEQQFGALVISLDFELQWGARDIGDAGPALRDRLLGARLAVPRLLDLFEEFKIGATWATVGLLFATNREEVEHFAPQTLPKYKSRELNPYEETIGNDEHDDPLHFAPSLIEAIRERPHQEIGSHTFSHYYCLEPGHTRESFAADLSSAKAIALHRGIELRSIVLPRNQFNESYEDLVVDAGFSCYRGNPAGWMYRAAPGPGPAMRRAARLIDSHVPAAGRLARWDEFVRPSGLCDIPASAFLRPWTPTTSGMAALRLRRLTRGIEKAGSEGCIFHLWWHPHNFGMHTDENLAFLRRVLENFDTCRDAKGMHSLTMAEAADVAMSTPADA